ncbi:MAG: ShlB/FhaC/HecB family hemolysin secretion/activation protein [Pseudomonadota bacterium]
MTKGQSAPRTRSGGLNRMAWVLAALLAGMTATHAQIPAAPSMASAAPAPTFAIRGFNVTGDNPLSQAETRQVLDPYLRTDATIDTLQKATAALEAALRARGFGLHRVALPPQEVGQTVTLNVVRFTVGKVVIEGASIYDETNVRRTLPGLQEGGSPNFQTLAVQTAIANENPNKLIQIGLREGSEPDKIDVTVTVQEKRPWVLALGLSNAGTRASGRDRFTVSGGHTNLFNRDHHFVGAYTTSLQKPDDVKQLGLSYRVPFYALGGVMAATYIRSDVVGDFGTFTSTGAGHTLGLSYSHYLPPDEGRRSYFTFGLEDKVFDAAVINGVVIGSDRRSRPATVSYSAHTDADNASWGYNIDLSANLSSGRNNDLASYQSESLRISTVNWKAVRAGGNYSARFAKDWLWSVRGQFQYSPDVLIIGEQFGLGGLGSVRGTDIDRPLTGDKGFMTSFEVTTPELATGLRLLGFLEGGWLGNNNPNGADKPSSDRLASAGVGFRFAREPLALSLDYGHIISGSKVPLAFNSAAPRRGDGRFYVNLSLRF